MRAGVTSGWGIGVVCGTGSTVSGWAPTGPPSDFRRWASSPVTSPRGGPGSGCGAWAWPCGPGTAGANRPCSNGRWPALFGLDHPWPCSRPPTAVPSPTPACPRSPGSSWSRLRRRRPGPGSGRAAGRRGGHHDHGGRPPPGGGAARLRWSPGRHLRERRLRAPGDRRDAPGRAVGGPATPRGPPVLASLLASTPWRPARRPRPTCGPPSPEPAPAHGRRRTTRATSRAATAATTRAATVRPTTSRGNGWPAARRGRGSPARPRSRSGCRRPSGRCCRAASPPGA